MKTLKEILNHTVPWVQCRACGRDMTMYAKYIENPAYQYHRECDPRGKEVITGVIKVIHREGKP